MAETNATPLSIHIEDDASDKSEDSEKRIDFKKLWQQKIDEINKAAQKANPHHLTTEHDREFQRYYFELDGMVDTVQRDMDNVIRKHEMNFIDSYRNHMRKVQRDLDKYKKALNEKEFMAKRNGRIIRLEQNVEWFKKEALDLSNINFKLKEKNLLLKQRNMLLEQEKKVAETATLRVRERTKQLHEALKLTNLNCTDLVRELKDIQRKAEMTRLGSVPKEPGPPIKILHQQSCTSRDLLTRQTSRQQDRTEFQ